MRALPRFRHHCCPVCANYVGFRRLWRSRPFHGEWQCPSCHTWLEVDYSSRILLGLLAGSWGAFLLVIVHPRHVGWTLLFFVLGAVIFSLVLRACVAEKSPRKEEQHP